MSTPTSIGSSTAGRRCVSSRAISTVRRSFAADSSRSQRGGVDVACDLAHLLGHHRLGRDRDVDEELRAERLGGADGAAEPCARPSPFASRRCSGRIPRPTCGRRTRAGPAAPRELGRDVQLLLADVAARPSPVSASVRLDEVHRRAADEAGDEEVDGSVEDRLRIARLLEQAAPETATRSPIVIASTWSCVT